MSDLPADQHEIGFLKPINILDTGWCKKKKKKPHSTAILTRETAEHPPDFLVAAEASKINLDHHCCNLHMNIKITHHKEHVRIVSWGGSRHAYLLCHDRERRDLI